MKLIIEDDEGRKTVIPVVRDEITIGRPIAPAASPNRLCANP